MLELLRLLAEVGDAANWIAIFLATIIAVFVLYVGIALCGVLRAPNKELGDIYLQAFHALLALLDLRRR
jgi:hypothetical protein